MLAFSADDRRMQLDLSQYTTESRNPDTLNLDQMTSLEIVTAMNREDAKVPSAVVSELPKIAAVADAVAASFEAGGRLIYMGAGTSGRLGVLDASECPPTFGVSPNLVIGLIAGGDVALRTAVEGAEDSEELGMSDLRAVHLQPNDVVVGIAASGRTPYVVGAFKYARQTGCFTAAISCNKNSEIGRLAHIAIEIDVGPEVLTGSTRLKSGTAQKLVLNMLTTTAMVRTGKAYENLMVNVVQSNDKLHTRAEHIVMDCTGVDLQEAREVIRAAGGNVKLAIIMILADTDRQHAEELLIRGKGHIRDSLRLCKTEAVK